MVSISRFIVLIAGFNLCHAASVPLEKRDTPYGPNLGASGDSPFWMSSLPDTLSIKDMSIPGTHQTMTYPLPDVGKEVNFAKCQTRDLTAQLNAGIRFIDVRLQHSINLFLTFHSQIPTGLAFGEVLQSINNFLDANPREAVFVRIRHETGFPEKGNTRSFAETFNWYRTTYDKTAPIFKKHGYNGPQNVVPTLGQMRGKFIVLQSFDGWQPAWGLPYSNSNSYMVIQDNYQVNDANTKWNAINNHVNAARNAPANDNRIYMSYTSGSTTQQNAESLRYTPYYIAMGFPGVKIPFLGTKWGYDGMNKRTMEMIQSWSRASGRKKAGIVIMDYPGQGLIDAIRALNRT